MIRNVSLKRNCSIWETFFHTADTMRGEGRHKEKLVYLSFGGYTSVSEWLSLVQTVGHTVHAAGERTNLYR